MSFTGQNQVDVNGTATFRCIIDGNTAPEVKWYKNGVEFQPFPREILVNNETFTRKEDSYRIQLAKPADMALYECEAKNIVLGAEKVVKKAIDFKVLCKLT